MELDAFIFLYVPLAFITLIEVIIYEASPGDSNCEICCL